MRNGARLVLVLGLVAAGCGNEPTGRTRDRPEEAGASPAVHNPSVGTLFAPDLIQLERLPAQGFVLGKPHGVEFVGLGGRVLDRLGGYRLYYDWTVPGPVILRKRRAFYVLNVTHSRLERLPSREAAFDLAPQFQEGVDLIAERYLDIERPIDAPVDTGFWAFALTSPTGSAVLAQWSGECESLTAFFIEGDGLEPRPVTGQRGLTRAPSSSVLGWASDGDAYVFLGQGGCGSGSPSTGVYRYRGVGDGELAIPVPDPRGVRMWGTA